MNMLVLGSAIGGASFALGWIACILCNSYCEDSMEEDQKNHSDAGGECPNDEGEYRGG